MANESIIKIRNKQATNALARISSKSNFVNDMGMLSLSMQYGKANLTFTLSNPTVTINQMSQKIFRILTGELSENNSCNISISLQKMMSFLGLKDIDNFRVSLKKSLEGLQALKVSGSYDSNSFSFDVLPEWHIANSILTIRFDDALYNYIQSKSLLKYPVKALQVESSDKRHPYSFFLVDKLIEQQNICKKDDFRIKIINLLVWCTNNGMPLYENVKNSNRNYKERIIEPFERDLNHLGKILKWNYDCGRRPTKFVDWVEEYINVSFY